MKGKKLLAIISILLFAFTIGAFAAEGEPGQDSGQQAATAQTTAPAAFSPSVDFKGWFLWSAEYSQTKDPLTKKITAASFARQLMYLNGVAKISQKVSITATLLWGSYWGVERNIGWAPGQAGTDGIYAFKVGKFGQNGYGTLGSDSERINVKTFFLTYEIGGFLGKISVGRMPAMWFMDAAIFGAYSGADRINWMMKAKVGGYLMLPFLIYELRNDYSSQPGDETHQILAGFVMVKPGSFLETIAFVANPNLSEKRFQSTWLGKHWNMYIFNVYTKMRIGSLLAIDLQVNFTIGGADYDNAKQEWKKVLGFIALAQVEINLGVVSIRPEILFKSAKPKEGASNLYPIVGNQFGNSDIGPYLMGQTIYGGNGEGLFYFTVLATIKLGSVAIRIEPGIGMYVGVTSPSGAYLGKLAGESGLGRFLGFEIDLGADFTLTDGLVFTVEFNYWLPSGIVAADGTQTYIDFSLAKYKYNFAIRTKLDFKF